MKGKSVQVPPLTNDTYQNCDVIVTNIAGSDSKFLKQKISYDPLLPVITNMYPLYGSSKGGTLLTITGTNFDTKNTILVDGVMCSI